MDARNRLREAQSVHPLKLHPAESVRLPVMPPAERDHLIVPAAARPAHDMVRVTVP